MIDEELVNRVREVLKQYGYEQSPEPSPWAEADGFLFLTPRRLIRNVVYITLIPDRHKTYEQIKIYTEKIRKSLSLKYAKFPFLGELGSLFVYLSSPHTFEVLRHKICDLPDKYGWHMNIILGVVVIDKEARDCVFATTPRFSVFKQHFEPLIRAVNDWRGEMQNDRETSSLL